MLKEVKDLLEVGRKFRQMTRAFGPILVVEDDKSTSLILKKIISFHGLKAIVVDNISDAMTCVQENSESIRCAIIDLHLGCDEGEEVIHFIETQHSRVPYLVYTADMDAGHRIEKKYPRATVLKKGESINRIVEALGFEI